MSAARGAVSAAANSQQQQQQQQVVGLLGSSCVQRIEEFLDACHFPLIFSLAVTGLTLAFTTCRYVMVNQPNKFHSYSADALNIVLMSVAIVVIVSLLAQSQFRVTINISSSSSVKSIFASFSSCRHIALAAWERLAIFSFFLGATFNNIFQLLPEVECIDEWPACSRLCYVNKGTRLANLVFQELFMAAELLFCLLYHARESARKSTWLMMGLGLIQVANLAIWFDSVLEESDLSASNHSDTNVLSGCACLFDMTSPGNSTLRHCISKSTPKHKLEETASPFLFPFVTEFFLLATKIVFDCIAVEADHHSAAAEPFVPVDASDTPDVPSEVNPSVNLAVKSSYTQRSETLEQTDVPTGLVTARQIPIDSDDDDVDVDDSRRLGLLPDVEMTDITGGGTLIKFDGIWNSFQPILIKLTFVFVCLLLPCHFVFVAVGVPDFYFSDDGDNVWFRQHFVRFRNCYWTLMLLLISAGFILGSMTSRHQLGTSRNVETFEYFVVLSSLGAFTQIFLTLIANVETTNEVSPTPRFLCDEVLNMFEEILQTMFYMYAARIQFHVNSDVPCYNNTTWIYRAVLLNMAMCNVCMWAEDSFVETHNKSKFFQQKYYDTWPVLYNITNPVVLSFRLNTMFLFLSLLPGTDQPTRMNDAAEAERIEQVQTSPD